MDKIYTKLIFATDLGPQSLYIGQHAIKLSKICHAHLVAFHVVEPPITYTANFSERDKIVKQVLSQAQKSLDALCSQLGIPPHDQIIKIGTPKEEILTYSIKHQCDLIVVGSHGIGGYTHALGSTAHHLLGEAHCDVLTIQVSHLQKEITDTPPSELYLWQTPLGAPGTPYVDRGPKYSGSMAGFGEDIKRGPRPTTRPPKAPIKGGTRTRASDEDDTDNKSDK